MKTVKELRSISGLSQTDFAKKYNIPFRTLQNWEADPTSSSYRKCPVYVNQMLERLVMIDFVDTF